MIRIGDFSKLSQVSIKTLRYYDEMGLFKPINVDRFTGYRYYSASQAVQSLYSYGFLFHLNAKLFPQILLAQIGDNYRTRPLLFDHPASLNTMCPQGCPKNSS